MNILISNASALPLYEQITEQVKQQIMTGLLQEGDALPSMRLLAKELRISVITTKRAYEDLERDGFIVTMAGKGSFVSMKNASLMREEWLRKIEVNLQLAIQQAGSAGLTLAELTEMLKILYLEGL